MNAEQVTQVIERLEAEAGRLQFQALNNLDTCTNSLKPDEKQDLDAFVKRPIMVSVTKLRGLAQSLKGSERSA
jgi:hypothetical protein